MAVATRSGMHPRLCRRAAQFLLLWGALVAGCGAGGCNGSPATCGSGYGPRRSATNPNRLEIDPAERTLRLRAFSLWESFSDNVPEGGSMTIRREIDVLGLLVDLGDWTVTVEKAQCTPETPAQAAARGLLDGPTAPHAQLPSFVYQGWDARLPWMQRGANATTQSADGTGEVETWSSDGLYTTGVLRLDSLTGAQSALFWRYEAQFGVMSIKSLGLSLVDCHAQCCVAYRLAGPDGEMVWGVGDPNIEVGAVLPLTRLPPARAAGLVDNRSNVYGRGDDEFGGVPFPYGSAGDQVAREIVCGEASPRPLSEWADFEACDFYDLMTNPAHYCP